MPKKKQNPVERQKQDSIFRIETLNKIRANNVGCNARRGACCRKGATVWTLTGKSSAVGEVWLQFKPTASPLEGQGVAHGGAPSPQPPAAAAAPGWARLRGAGEAPQPGGGQGARLPSDLQQPLPGNHVPALRFRVPLRCPRAPPGGRRPPPGSAGGARASCMDQTWGPGCGSRVAFRTDFTLYAPSCTARITFCTDFPLYSQGYNTSMTFHTDFPL